MKTHLLFLKHWMSVYLFHFIGAFFLKSEKNLRHFYSKVETCNSNLSTLFVANRFPFQFVFFERIQTKHPPGSFHSDRLFLCVKESFVLDHCLFFLDTKHKKRFSWTLFFFWFLKVMFKFCLFSLPLEFHSIWFFMSLWVIRFQIKKQNKKFFLQWPIMMILWVDIIFVPNNKKWIMIVFFFLYPPKIIFVSVTWCM